MSRKWCEICGWGGCETIGGKIPCPGPNPKLRAAVKRLAELTTPPDAPLPATKGVRFYGWSSFDVDPEAIAEWGRRSELSPEDEA